MERVFSTNSARATGYPHANNEVGLLSHAIHKNYSHYSADIKLQKKTHSFSTFKTFKVLLRF